MKRKWKVVLSGVAAGILLSAAALAAAFTDMPVTGHWSAEALTAAVNNGLLQGENGLLHPQSPLSRAEMATIVNRAFGATAAASLSSYTDVPSGVWYESEMAKAVAMKTFEGYERQLKPAATITRGEAFTVLARALGLSGGDASALASYTDGNSVDDWATDAIASLVEAGYVEGKNGRLHPEDAITREEFAQVMHNLCKNYVIESGTYTEDYAGNVIIRVPDVTLDGLTVNGDLILGDGIGSGDITLQDVKVTGRLVVRGGGENSVKLLGSTTVNTIVASKTSGSVRIVNENTNASPNAHVLNGHNGSAVTFEGPLGVLEVGADNVTVKAVNATIDSISISGQNSYIILDKNTTAQTVTMEKVAANSGVVISGTVKGVNISAADASLTVDAGGSVDSVSIAATARDTTVNTVSGSRVSAVTTAGTNTTVTGQGSVGTVTATSGASRVQVETSSTKVKAEEGSSGVTAGGTIVNSGASATVGGSSSSGSSGSSVYTLSLTISDDTGRSKTTASRYNTRSSSLLGAMASAASTNETALDATFANESTLYSIFHEGLTAYEGDVTAWNDFVDTYDDDVTGTDKSTFFDRNSTLASLTLNTDYTLSYSSGGKTYILTVRVTRG